MKKILHSIGLLILFIRVWLGFLFLGILLAYIVDGFLPTPWNFYGFYGFILCACITGIYFGYRAYKSGDLSLIFYKINASFDDSYEDLKKNQ